MLPGFRFLSVAIVLGVSMLIFGLGAAALLRATHEEFASLPLKQMPEVTFGSREETEQPTLAVLQVDPPNADPAEPEDQAAAQNPPSATTGPQPEFTAIAAIPAPDATAMARPRLHQRHPTPSRRQQRAWQPPPMQTQQNFQSRRRALWLRSTRITSPNPTSRKPRSSKPTSSNPTSGYPMSMKQ